MVKKNASIKHQELICGQLLKKINDRQHIFVELNGSYPVIFGICVLFRFVLLYKN